MYRIRLKIILYHYGDSGAETCVILYRYHVAGTKLE